MTAIGLWLDRFPRKGSSWPAYLFCLLLPIVLFGPSIATGAATFFPWGDAVEQSYAWLQKLTVALHNGYLPLWNANSQGGTSFVGEIQTGVFYPVSLIVAWVFGSETGLPLIVAEAWVALHFVVGLVCFHWLARDLGACRSAAVCGAMVFALLGPVAFRSAAQVGIFFGLVWMPLALMLAHRFIQGRSFWYAMVAGLVVGLQLIAGHISPPLHTMLLIAAFAAHYLFSSANRPESLRRFTAGAAIFGLGLVLISMPQLFLGWEYLREVYRWVSPEVYISSIQRVPVSIFLSLNTLTPSAMLSLVNPWQFAVADTNILYVGLPTLSLLTIAIWRFRSPTMKSLTLYNYRWLIWLAVGSTMIALGAYTPVAGLLYFMPLGTAVRSLGRYMILFHMACAILLTFVVDAQIRKRVLSVGLASWPSWVWVTIFALTMWLNFFKYSPMIEPVARQLMITVALLAILRWLPAWGTLAIVASIVLSVFLVRDFYILPIQGQVVPVTQRFTIGPAAQYILQQDQPSRVLIDDSADLPKNFGIVTGVQTKLGHSATYYRPYFDFLSQDWSIDSKVNDALNVRWVISKAPQNLPLILVEPDSELKLYKRTSAYPRAWLASQFDRLGRANYDISKVTVTDYTDHHIGVKLETQASDVLFLSEVDYPGWYAWVDGSPVPTVKGEVPGLPPLFRTVAIAAAGVHQVDFRYQPWRNWSNF